MINRKYKWILLDLDDTLFDYAKTEYYSLQSLCSEFFGKFNEDIYKSYSLINRKYWTAFQKDEIKIDDVKVGRFKEFTEVNFPDKVVDPQILSERFIDFLSESTFLLDGAIDFLEFLIDNKYQPSVVTNGIKRNQLSRIKLSGVSKYFEHIIISEEVGFAKPRKEYFDYAKSRIGFENKSALIIGDNIETDIQLGYNHQVDTCWFNPTKKENHFNIKPTHEVRSFDEIKRILK
ncbi:MAG: YjjG family noncanonical pyrimidine nucleotidase [Melioribacteraceae bacterium]|nr:YjjG family noncanonical pyrimidine nucleotidase [Melioribacteraceae bacterium]